MFKIVGLVAFAALTIMAAVGANMAWNQAQKVEHAERTPAVILKKHLHSYVSQNQYGPDTTMYLPQVTYRCGFDGGEVVSSDVYPFEMARGGTEGRNWAKSILARYEVGQTVQAWFNPNDVRQTFLIREISFFPYIFILVAGFIASLFVASFARAADDVRNRKLAMCATLLMCLIGGIVWYHYFSLADDDTDGIVKPLMAGYFATILIPFILSLPKSGATERLRSALVLAAALGFVGIWLGLLGGGAIGFVTQVCKGLGWIDESFGGPHWAMYTIPALSGLGFLFGLIANKSKPDSDD